MTRAEAASADYRSQIFEAADLSAIVEAWARLYDHAVEANLFFGPDYLLPLATTVGVASRFSACTVWRGERLVALAPLLRSTPGLGIARALTHPMVVGGVPLLDRDDPAGAADALLEALAGFGHAIYLIDDARLDWPAWRAIEAAAARRGGGTQTFGEHHRAAAAAGGASGPDGRQKKIARNLKRLAARLGERGKWVVRAPQEPGARAQALRDLLAIEAAGWKGEEGTALASRPETLAFAQAAFHPDNQRPRCDYHVLEVDGRTVAAAINLIGHDHGAAFKCAYDEAYSSFSPGVLLDAAMADEAHVGGFGGFIDSVTTAGHPVERLWRDGVRVGAGVVSLGRGFGGRAAFALGVELTRRRLRAAAKQLYHRLKARGAAVAPAAPVRADGD